MFEISELKAKKLPELQDIAKSLNVPKFRTLKKLDLVYQILDYQAANPKKAKEALTDDTKKEESPKSEATAKTSEKPQAKKGGKIGSNKKPPRAAATAETKDSRPAKKESNSPKKEEASSKSGENKKPEQKQRDTRDDNSSKNQKNNPREHKKIRAIKITEAAIAETVIAAIATANQITSLMRLLKVKVYWTLCRITTVS